MESYVYESIDYGNDVFPPQIFFPVSRARLACVASISSRVIARKLEREQKKNGRGRGKREEETLARKPLHSFFCSRPNFLDEHARKPLLRRLVRDFYTVVNY